MLLCAMLAVAGAVGRARQTPENEPATAGVRPNLLGNIDRPLRYRPEGTDFVIENGAEFFNRPLYGGHTAFRVDAGDKPEFTLYLPGRGGNLRLGVLAGDRSPVAPRRPAHRYALPAGRDGLRDSRSRCFGGGVLHLTVLALHTREGLIARVEAAGGAPAWSWSGPTAA